MTCTENAPCLVEIRCTKITSNYQKYSAVCCGIFVHSIHSSIDISTRHKFILKHKYPCHKILHTTQIKPRVKLTNSSLLLHPHLTPLPLCSHQAPSDPPPRPTSTDTLFGTRSSGYQGDARAQLAQQLAVALIYTRRGELSGSGLRERVA
jgi:hypothetical protein